VAETQERIQELLIPLHAEVQKKGWTKA
jgi:hypothetical protein